jgi:hypothetical protein
MLDSKGEGGGGGGGGGRGSYGGGASDAPSNFDRSEMDDEIPF